MKLQNSAKDDDESTPMSFASMVDILMRPPTRFISIRKILRIAATLPRNEMEEKETFPLPYFQRNRGTSEPPLYCLACKLYFFSAAFTDDT